MFANILVPLDGSEGAGRALDTAIALTKRFGGELSLLCVFRHHSPLEASLSMVQARGPLDRPDDALKGYAGDIVAAAKAHAIEAGVTPKESIIKRGQPARAIVAFAKDRGIDAIVMGSRGTGDMEGFLLGSVSHKVSSLAPCTCVTVK
jgi:nucleotide-binding universal stress UspA family protein